MAQHNSPIAALPDNDALPAEAHNLADQWRNLDERLTKTPVLIEEWRRAVLDGQREDAEALKAAVLADKPAPAKSKEDEARAGLARVEQQAGILREEHYRISTELVTLLRTDEAREHIARKAAERIAPALETYRETLAEAARKVSADHRALTQATAILGLVDALDTGKQARLVPLAVGGTPNFTVAQQQAAQVRDRLDRLTERARPTKRDVRLTNGRIARGIPASLAADMHRDKRVAEWLDGWPPEAPSPAVPIPAA